MKSVGNSTSALAGFYALLDDGEERDLAAHLADDLQFEVMLPAGDGAPSERFHGGKQGFQRLIETWDRSPQVEHSESPGRHDIDTSTLVDGVELAVGRSVGGRRNDTVLAVAQSDAAGKLRRYASVMSSAVQFSEPDARVPDPAPDLLTRYFDRVDGISLEESIDLVADDYQFEMVFPGLDGGPDERNSVSKDDFRRFQAGVRARLGPRRRVSQAERRHHTRISTVANGLVLVLADTIGGRRNGTVIAAAEADEAGLMRRYLIGMTPTVRFD